jgi:hypothetical protein
MPMPCSQSYGSTAPLPRIPTLFPDTPMAIVSLLAQHLPTMATALLLLLLLQESMSALRVFQPDTQLPCQHAHPGLPTLVANRFVNLACVARGYCNSLVHAIRFGLLCLGVESGEKFHICGSGLGGREFIDGSGEEETCFVGGKRALNIILSDRDNMSRSLPPHALLHVTHHHLRPPPLVFGVRSADARRRSEHGAVLAFAFVLMSLRVDLVLKSVSSALGFCSGELALQIANRLLSRSVLPLRVELALMVCGVELTLEIDHFLFLGALLLVLPFVFGGVPVLVDLGLEGRELELELELVDTPYVSFAGAVAVLGFL